MAGAVELRNEFAWSWSRHQMFYECARRLYWQYYGSWGGWLDDAPAQARLGYRLKQLKSVAMLVGEAFHEVVGEVLLRRPPESQPVPTEQLRIDMLRRVRKRIRESHNRDWARYENVKRYTNLFEDYYGVGVDEVAEEKALEDIRACVDGFARSPYGRRVFAMPGDRIAIIDPQNFDDKRFVLDGIAVFASPDLIVRDQESDMHIVDWKTGRPDKARLAQLSIYGLFVREKFGAPLERMTAHLVYVRTGETERHGDLAAGAGEARRMLATYVADVRGRLTDVERNLAGDIERFPMTTDLRMCRRCNFRELCGRTQETALAPEEEPAEK